MSALRLYVEPSASLAEGAVRQVVEAAGGSVVDRPDLATAILWTSRDVAGLNDALHPGIAWVQLGGVGIETWFASDVFRHPATFTYAGGYFGEQVAEHALALLLACSRRLMTCARATSWAEGPAVEGTPLANATVCVVGTGDIGTHLIRMLVPLAPRLLAVNRSGRPVPNADSTFGRSELKSALSQSDYVVLCVPSTGETRHLFNADGLAAMRRDAWLVNVGRGDAIDSDALVAALDSGQLAGAALDVTDPEPLPDGHPLWSHPRVLITPHVANPPEARDASLLRLIGENARRFVEGRELTSKVNVERGY